MMRTNPRAGFTLTETLVAAAMLAVLVAVAAVSMHRQARRRSAYEATVGVARIYMGQVAYYQASAERGARGFVDAPELTPGGDPGAERFAAEPMRWALDPRWSAIGFSLDQPHHHAYASPGLGRVEGDGPAFTALAVGDLDGDDVNSSFSRVGSVRGGDVVGGAVVVVDELE